MLLRNPQTSIYPLESIFKSMIEPISLCSGEVWGPLANQDSEKWDKHPIGILYTEICKSILRVHRNTPNNGCPAEPGQSPLLIRIQKRAIKFYKHLKTSYPNSYHYKTLQCQEEDTGKSPLRTALTQSGPKKL